MNSGFSVSNAFYDRRPIGILYKSNIKICLLYIQVLKYISRGQWRVGDCCMRVTLSILAPEIPDNTMHWPNTDVMLGHCPQRWANIIPKKNL